MTYPRLNVLRSRALDGHRLWLRCTDGGEGVRDCFDILARGGPMVVPLRSPDYFARVFVDLGVPTCANGFDLEPINLYVELRDAGLLEERRSGVSLMLQLAGTLFIRRFAEGRGSRDRPMDSSPWSCETRG